MLQQIKEVLANAELQQQVKEATHLTDAINLIVAAGAEKGYNFTTEAVSQALAELASVEPDELSDKDLLAVSGGLPRVTEAWSCYKCPNSVDNC
ncbi:MAG: Nif11-like leader peptide family RiPP precursor [Aphanothece sp. CMT-3BRIN-NPC111]|nr:Nif11-like leader peptide family RiPP precursor [Aphanothece sp. CMT-3BRIN-NPC111]